MLHILRKIDQGTWSQVSSEMAVIEINSIADLQRRNRILSMLPSDIMRFDDMLLRRAAELQALGIRPADAVHVGAAELLNADAFLTCDDRLLKVARRHKTKLRVRLANPALWINDHE